MLRKKLVTLGMATVMAIAALSGCKGQSGSTQEVASETTSETVKTTEPTTPEATTREEEPTSKEETTPSQAETSSEVMGRVDADDICKNIYINGKLVEFPWTLNKLGEEYEFGYISNSNDNDGKCAAYIYYQGKKMIVVGIRGEEANRDSDIYYISFDFLDNVFLYDFGKGTTKENMVEKLGEPDEKLDGDGITDTYKYKTENLIISFSFYVKDGTLENINLTLKDVFFE